MRYPTTRQSEEPLSVTQLNREARFILEDNFPAVLVEGEISNIAIPASGHWYLTLKDKSAQIRCAMFRNRNQSVRFRPENGMQVLLKAKLSLYEGRGDYQLIVERMEELGDGALRQAFEQLKQRLLDEGLFDEAYKQPLPDLPKHIGIITSPTGAAIKDMISVLERRFPGIPITILPVSVQGASSASEMIKAIQTANAKKGCLKDLDVLIIGRGGGSLEDLWSFNDEGLARAIFSSALPIVSAVGHEVDFTIVDFVADLRAATPSAAAELLSPDQQEYYSLALGYRIQLSNLMKDKISQQRQQLTWLSKQLRHPGRRIQEQVQRLDETEARLKRALQNKMLQARHQVQQLHSALRLHSPQIKINSVKQQNSNAKANLKKSMQYLLSHKKQLLAQQSHALNTVSPLSTLSRGYSISYSDKGEVLSDISQLTPGEKITTRLHQGEIVSTIEKLLS